MPFMKHGLNSNNFNRMAETRGMNFFSEDNVLERFKRPPSYFEKISTVAFKPVSSGSSKNFE